MISKTFYTGMIDDAAKAAEELAKGVRDGMTLMRHTVGIVTCYSDMEIDELIEQLSRQLPFEWIGASCIAAMESESGFLNMAASILVMTADDCVFSTAVSDVIVPGQVRDQVARVYESARQRLGDEEPKLIYAIPPYNLSIMLDEYADALNEIAPGLPVVGGLPSNNSTEDLNVTLHNGQMHHDRMVMLMIAGNINPVFTVMNVRPSAVERKRKVTSSKANTVFTVGNQPFTEYLKDIGFPIEHMDEYNSTTLFVSNPLLLENVQLEAVPDGAFSFVRTLHKVDLEEGSGTAIGGIPEGATLSLTTLNKEDIREAADVGAKQLMDQMKAHPDVKFSTVLTVSCIGRHLILTPQAYEEAEALRRALPKELTLFGFYGYGEIGPQKINDQWIRNFAHNESLVLCAL